MSPRHFDIETTVGDWDLDLEPVIREEGLRVRDAVAVYPFLGLIESTYYHMIFAGDRPLMSSVVLASTDREIDSRCDRSRRKSRFEKDGAGLNRLPLIGNRPSDSLTLQTIIPASDEAAQHAQHQRCKCMPPRFSQTGSARRTPDR